MAKKKQYIPRDNSDELKPVYLFSTKATDLLVAIVNGQIDAVELAKIELMARGLDPKTGKWVGFKKMFS